MPIFVGICITISRIRNAPDCGMSRAGIQGHGNYVGHALVCKLELPWKHTRREPPGSWAWTTMARALPSLSCQIRGGDRPSCRLEFSSHCVGLLANSCAENAILRHLSMAAWLLMATCRVCPRGRPLIAYPGYGSCGPRRGNRLFLNLLSHVDICLGAIGGG